MHTKTSEDHRKPPNTGRIDEHVACVREWVANIFFYRKGDTTIMIDAGYNDEKRWAGWGLTPRVSGISSLPTRIPTMWVRRKIAPGCQ